MIGGVAEGNFPEGVISASREVASRILRDPAVAVLCPSASADIEPAF